jgi:hypothetical protein
MVATAGVALMFVTGVPPQTHASGQTRCTYAHEVHLTPGLSTEGSSGTFGNVGGTLDCDGPFLGIEPTGPGSFHDTGSYGTKDPDTCQGGGEGAGTIVFTFPTADGERSVSSTYTMVHGGLSTRPSEGILALRVESDDWVAEGSATPIEGNCITRPVTRIRDKGVFTTNR